VKPPCLLIAGIFKFKLDIYATLGEIEKMEKCSSRWRQINTLLTYLTAVAVASYYPL